MLFIVMPESSYDSSSTDSSSSLGSCVAIYDFACPAARRTNCPPTIVHHSLVQLLMLALLYTIGTVNLF